MGNMLSIMFPDVLAWLEKSGKIEVLCAKMAVHHLRRRFEGEVGGAFFSKKYLPKLTYINIRGNSGNVGEKIMAIGRKMEA